MKSFRVSGGASKEGLFTTVEGKTAAACALWTLLELFLADVLHEPAGLDEPLHEGWDRPGAVGLPAGQVLDFPVDQVDGEPVAFLQFLRGIDRLEERQPDVEGVAVENPGEALRDDDGDAGSLDGDGGVLPGGAAAEVSPPTITSPGETVEANSGFPSAKACFASKAPSETLQ